MAYETSPAYLVSLAPLVADTGAVALVVEAALVAAPALVAELGGHVRGVPLVAVLEAQLAKKRQRMARRKKIDSLECIILPYTKGESRVSYTPPRQRHENAQQADSKNGTCSTDP